MENTSVVMPEVPEYEKQVLGMVLRDEELNEGPHRTGALTMALGELKAEDFYSPTNRRIFEAISGLAKEGKPINALTMYREKLSQKPDNDILLSDLVELSEQAGSPWNIAYYVKCVAETSQKQKTYTLLQQALSGGVEGVWEAMNAIKAGIDRIARIGKPVPSLAEDLPELWEKIMDPDVKPVPTFSPTLNYNLNGGLQGGKLYMIVAPAGGGKTTFAWQLLEEVAVKNRIPCIFVAMEMSRRELFTKSLSRWGQINGGRIEGKQLSEKEMSELGRVLTDYEKKCAPYMHVIEGTVGLTVAKIRSDIERIRFQYRADGGDLPLAVLCVDPMQRLSSGNEHVDADETARVGIVANQLKTLARDAGIAILGLSDTTKAAAEKSFGGGPMGQTGLRGSYMLAHIPDVTAEIRTGRNLVKLAGAKDPGSGEGEKYGNLASAWPLKKASGKFETYAMLEVSKQRSGARMNAVFLYYQALNEFKPIERVKENEAA